MNFFLYNFTGVNEHLYSERTNGFAWKRISFQNIPVGRWNAQELMACWCCPLEPPLWFFSLLFDFNLCINDFFFPFQTITEKHKLNVPETMTEVLDVSDEEGKTFIPSSLSYTKTGKPSFFSGTKPVPWVWVTVS